MLNIIRKAQDRKNDKGFTLIELVIVVAILGILAGVGIPNLIGALNKAKVESLYANNTVLLKEFNVKAVQAGLMTDVNGSYGGATMGQYIQLASEIAHGKGPYSEPLPGDLWTGFSFGVNGDGDIEVCAFTFKDDDSLSRVTGPDSCNKQGPKDKGLLEY